MLEEVKKMLGIVGEYHDATISLYIEEINGYLKSAGVKDELIGTNKTVGVVSRGVIDLWNYGSGEGQLSPYFYERAIQLATEED